MLKALSPNWKALFRVYSNANKHGDDDMLRVFHLIGLTGEQLQVCYHLLLLVSLTVPLKSIVRFLRRVHAATAAAAASATTTTDTLRAHHASEIQVQTHTLLTYDYLNMQ
jgi:hypothetical protein